MSFWTLDSIKSIVGGTWICRPESLAERIAAGETPLGGVSTDTRTIRPGNVFFALRGDRFDGTAFVAAAARGGAPLAIVNPHDGPGESHPVLAALEPEARASMGVLVAPDDTGAALLRLAGAYRKTLEGTRVIAVGGSNGKTTTTQLIHAVLGEQFRGSASIKSFNNAVGVPLTIFGARKGDQYLVCEVGTNAPGELATLASVIAPDIAVITSIGREHLEGLGSLAGVAREEASLLSFLRPGGVAIVPADAPELGDAIRVLAIGEGARAPTFVRFGVGEQADLRVTSVEASRSPETPGVRFQLNGRFWYQIPLVGEHNALNAAAAIGVARRLGMVQADIERGLLSARGPAMRMELRSATFAGGELRVLNDAYNANPDSMLAAIRTLATLGAGATRRVAILGDMLELGPSSRELHAEIGRAIASSGTADLCVFVGEHMQHAAAIVRTTSPQTRVVNVPSSEPAEVALMLRELRPGDFVLLKGSRRMALERVLVAIEADGREAGGVKHENDKLTAIEPKAPTPAKAP
ncbi:MAG: UDP-N-acetylmuramoyl-tripeptide--D-alanyl-D-alanine ligase [Planctomycetota bacterium]|nr:UDP-N-acetylmuramoyl-tripeptide--D-alanyl-D-alanine ligase [Planctomycetota bacterium]